MTDLFADVRRRREPSPWPLAPLAAATSTPNLAGAIGVSASTLARYAAEGLTDWQADRAAIALRLHPALVWPGWFSAVEQVPA